MSDEEADGGRLISLPSATATCVRRAKKPLFSSGSLCGDGAGKEDGWLYTKPPSPGRRMQSCVFSGTDLFLRPLSLTYPFARLSGPPLAHSFTSPRVCPAATEQLPRARCSARSRGRNAARAPRLRSARRLGVTEKRPPAEAGRRVRDHLPQPRGSAESSSKPRARLASLTLLTVHRPGCRVSGVRRRVGKKSLLSSPSFLDVPDGLCICFSL